MNKEQMDYISKQVAHEIYSLLGERMENIEMTLGLIDAKGKITTTKKSAKKPKLYDYLKTLAEAGREKQWLKAGDLARADDVINNKDALQVGKALAVLSREGFVINRKARANKVEYFI